MLLFFFEPELLGADTAVVAALGELDFLIPNVLAACGAQESPFSRQIRRSTYISDMDLGDVSAASGAPASRLGCPW